MDIEDDERSVKPLVLFGHHMVTDGTNPPKDTKMLSFLEPRPAGTGLLGALKTEKFKDHQLWVFSGETRVATFRCHPGGGVQMLHGSQRWLQNWGRISFALGDYYPS